MKEQENMVNVTVLWRGNKYMVEMNSGANLKELGDELQKLTEVKADTLRLIVPQLSGKGSRMLHPFLDEHSCLSLQEASIVMGQSIRMMWVPEDEVERVIQNSKVDLRKAGFNEEERRPRQRMSDGPHASIRLPQGPYIFCDFCTLQIPGVEFYPAASEALKRMHMLASDPGIVAIMNKHRWRVGIMTEMAPVGYVGVSPTCILGFNKNHGEEISLRLRTDDLNGLRKYESIKKTLIHELAHMVFSEHDSNFYALDKQLNEEAVSLDWTKSKGHTISGIRHSDNYQEDFYVEDARSSQKVGGNMSTLLENARSSSVAAAYRRLVNASANVEASEIRDEPDPDDSGSTIHDGNENLDIQSPIRALGKLAYEPDPDDLSSNQNKFEPDPDDMLHGETLLLKHHSESTKNISQKTLGKSAAMCSSEEPDPDDSGASSFGNVVEPMVMEILDTKILTRETIDEPDPDDGEAQSNILGCTSLASHDPRHHITTETLVDQAHFNQGHKEPDPDETKAGEIAQAEPHPEDKLLPQLGIYDMKIDEPDPDDQELQRIRDSGLTIHNGNENLDIQSPIRPVGKLAYEPDPDDLSSNQNKFEPDPDDLLHGETLLLKHHSASTKNYSQKTLGKSATICSSEEPDPDDSGASSFGHVVEPVVMEILDTKILTRETIDEPDPDDGEAQSNILGCPSMARHDPGHHITTETLVDQARFNQGHKEPDPDETKADEIAQAEPHPDDKLLPQLGIYNMKIDEPDPDDQELQRIQDSGSTIHDGNENLDIQSPIRPVGKLSYEPDPDDLSGNQNKFEPDPDDLLHGETLLLKHHSESTKNDSQKTLGKSAAMCSSEEPDPDDSGASSFGNVVEPMVMEILDTKILTRETIDEPDPDDGEAQSNILGCTSMARHDPRHHITTETLVDQAHFNQGHKEPHPDETKADEIAQAEPHPDDKLLPQLGKYDMKIDEPDPDDKKLQRIRDSVTDVFSRLQKAIEMLRAEVNPKEATIVLQTLFKIIRNLIKHADEMKFRKLRKANPIIQRNVANYKAIMEILLLIGFSEDVILDDIGKAETYIVLKRNDPSLLWLAKSSLETCIAY